MKGRGRRRHRYAQFSWEMILKEVKEGKPGNGELALTWALGSSYQKLSVALKKIHLFSISLVFRMQFRVGHRELSKLSPLSQFLRAASPMEIISPASRLYCKWVEHIPLGLRESPGAVTNEKPPLWVGS